MRPLLAAAALLAVLLAPGCAPRQRPPSAGPPALLEWPGLEPGPHPVGFRAWTVTDDTRTLGRALDLQGRPRRGFGSRQVEVALWYPAAAARPMTWGDYLPLLVPGGSPQAVEAELAALRAITPAAGPEAPGLMARFRAQPVLASGDAPPAPGPFPVVVYAPGGGYPVFDNSVLCELLASHGFVVIATPSSGAARRALSYTALDLEAGARDLELLAGLARSLPQADRERLAVMGFSWGGIPAGLLAMRHGRVRALVSIDSTLGEPTYGRLTAGLSGFDPAQLRLPLLAVSAAPGVGVGHEGDSPVGRAAQADLTRVTLLRADHHDLSSFAGLLRRSARPAAPEATATYELLCRTVLGFLDATLRSGAATPTAVPGLSTVDRRPANEAAPTLDDLFDLIDEGGVGAALEALRARRQAAPAEFARYQPAINLAGYMLFAQGQQAGALRLLAFNVESFPGSFNAWDSLAEAHLGGGDLAEAERCYGEARRRVERDPTLAEEARAGHLGRIDAALAEIRRRRGADGR